MLCNFLAVLADALHIHIEMQAVLPVNPREAIIACVIRPTLAGYAVLVFSVITVIAPPGVGIEICPWPAFQTFKCLWCLDGCLVAGLTVNYHVLAGGASFVTKK